MDNILQKLVRYDPKLHRFILISPGINNGSGLGYVNRIDPLFNPHHKYVTVLENLLCHHCGSNGHLKVDCSVLKGIIKSLSEYSRKKRPSKESGSNTKKYKSRSPLGPRSH